MTRYLITGASGGIGSALAKALLAQGHEVWGVGLENPPPMASEFAVFGARSRYSSCDVAQPVQVGSVLQQMTDADFEPDVAIFCAGVNPEQNAKRFSFDLFSEVLRVNLLGTIAWIDGLLPLFLKRGRGQFAALSSLSAFRKTRDQPAYCTSKAALNRAFSCFQERYGRAGIQFTIINLHTVEAGMGRDVNSPFRLDLNRAVAEILRAVARKSPWAFVPGYLRWAAPFFGLIPDRWWPRRPP